MMRKLLVMVILAAAIGFTLGSLRSTASLAHHSWFHFWFAIPAELDNNNALLTSSWHGPDGGLGLDWDNQPNLTTQIRAWAQTAGPETFAAYAWWNNSTPWFNCQYVVWIDFYDFAWNEWRGSVAHVHTHQPQFGQYDFYSRPENHWNEGRPAANMITFPDTCTTSGSHVHETHLAGPTGVMGRGVYSFPEGWHWNTDGNKWTRELSWN